MTKKEIESQLKKIDKERSQLIDELDELKRNKNLPALKKKYEGKYFKFDNGYSTEERWNLYSYCTEVIDIDTAICDMFELENLGKWMFEVGDKTGLWLFQTEITQEEYDEASLNLLSAVQLIRQLKEPNDTRRNKKSKA